MDDKKIMDFCIQLARQGVDLEALFNDLKSIPWEAIALAIKNYKFINKSKKSN